MFSNELKEITQKAQEDKQFKIEKLKETIKLEKEKHHKECLDFLPQIVDRLKKRIKLAASAGKNTYRGSFSGRDPEYEIAKEIMKELNNLGIQVLNSEYRSYICRPSDDYEYEALAFDFVVGW